MYGQGLEVQEMKTLICWNKQKEYRIENTI